MKSVLITGASGGIGKVITQRFIEEAYAVTMLARTEETLKNTKINLEKKYKQARLIYHTADITQQKDIESGFEHHLKMYHAAPSVIVHCAALQSPISPLWKTNPQTWEQTLKVNVLGSYLLARTTIQQAIKHQTPCSIILFSGGGAAYARANFSAYGSSKTAVLRLVETTAEELRLNHLDHLIQINAISPGAVNTKMTEEIIQSGPQQAGDNAYQEAKQVIDGHGSSPQKAAELCLFLADRQKNAGLSGRLLHANEPYHQYIEQIKNIQNSEKGLLRRVPFDE